ncbi:hypothetical protein BC829DRAFT_488597 [Chytridium lagenaria]|nr:hypothetical protein BC829DRAFT_488597 [Chytridium lagenaria]
MDLLQGMDEHLAFDRDALELMYEKLKGFPQEMDITRKTYTSLLMREILVHECAKEQVLHPLYKDVQKNAYMVEKMRKCLAEMKKDIRDVMLIGSTDPNFDKKVESITHRALDLCGEDAAKHLPSLKSVMGEKKFQEVGKNYERAKAAVLEQEPLLSEFPMAFDERIVKDHMLVKKLFEDFKKAKDPEVQNKIAASILRNISIHSFSEELVIYPMYEKAFRNGHDIAEASRHEHNIVKQDASKVESIEGGDPALIEMMKKLEKDFFEHGDHEETREIPTLLTVLSREEAVKLGERFEKHKGSAPTHSHPSAPDKGGLTQKLAGMVTVPLDKARDAMSHA